VYLPSIEFGYRTAEALRTQSKELLMKKCSALFELCVSAAKKRLGKLIAKAVRTPSEALK
jgi:hypothetical protein